MRQLTASEASNDEIERSEFERIMRLSPSGYLFDFSLDESGVDYKSIATKIVFKSWLMGFRAALKGKQGEV